MLRGRARIALAAIAVLLAVAAAVSLAGGSPHGGSRALPAARNFTLPVLGHPRQRVALAAYAGRAVIVNFFASWCVPRKKETPLLARFYRAQRGRVTILGVDSNDAAAAASGSCTQRASPTRSASTPLRRRRRPMA